MNAYWILWTARLDAMSNRERLLAFCAVLGILFLVFHVGFIEPAGDRLRLANQRLSSDGDAVTALEGQKQALLEELRRHPDEPFMRRIAAADSGIAEIDREIQDLGAGLARPERMAGLVKDVLARSPRIALVAMRNLPPVPFVEGSVDGVDAGDLYRHGIEITVEGAWPELVAYAGRLESLPVRVLWGRTRVDAAAWPRVTMTLNLHTLSLERTWLTL
jgi:MSHA biogenesis protein MshJ